MKAIVCTKYGPPEVLQLRELDKPNPGNQELLIKVFSTSVTIGDARVRAFDIPPSYRIPARLALGIRKPRRPILGSVFAGEIEEVGKDVPSFKRGDRVFGTTSSHKMGAYAEFLCMSAKGCVAMIPKGLSFEEAAAIPWGNLTSWHFLNKADIRKGHKVLINGASGSVGIAAVQQARSFGAHVTAVCSTPNLEMVRSFGANETIDYTRDDFAKFGGNYDIIFDVVGKCKMAESLELLSPEGVFLHAVATPDVIRQMKRLSRSSGKKMIGGTLSPDAEMLNSIKALVEKGHIKPVIDRTYSLEQIVEAHAYVDTGRKKGDVIITIA